MDIVKRTHDLHKLRRETEDFIVGLAPGRLEVSLFSQAPVKNQVPAKKLGIKLWRGTQLTALVRLPAITAQPEKHPQEQDRCTPHIP